jgi:thiol-disulfide isomerase/thioredoxin
MRTATLSQRIAVATALAAFAFTFSIAAPRAEEGPMGRALVLKVVDWNSGAPVGSAAIKLQINRTSRDLTTDAEGRLTIALPTETGDYVMITARAEDRVPVEMSWRREAGVIKLPDEYTLRLERGTTIGGLIKDEEGRPIAGATIYLLVPSQVPHGEPRVSLWDYPVKTDAQGHWRCDVVPAEVDDVWIRLAHSDYISDTSYNQTPRPAIGQLRDQSGVMVMKKGVTVRGRVVDADSSKPLESAKVAQGRDRFGSHYPTARTGADGRFEFRSVKPGELVLTVQAQGHAPDLKTLTVGADPEEVEFRLRPGRTIRGRLFDHEGKPVAGAFVAADTWRGYRSLEWRVDTDAEGRFRWDEAPPDAVLVDMGKQGYFSVRRRSMTPADEEYNITMPRPLRIRGTVVDAATGKPVEAFTVVTGINRDSNRTPHWDRDRARSVTGGHYEVSFTEPYPIHLVRIEAPGYQPLVSREFKSDEGEQVFDARLEPGRDAAGVARLPDGTPLEGADVVLVPAKQNLFLQDGRAPDRRIYNVTRTDAQGRFRFPPQDGPFQVIVLHDRGYARRSSVQLAGDEVVPAKSWGRVEGTLRVGKQVAASEQVNINGNEQGQEPRRAGEGMVSFSSTATADAEGRFRFDRVPPGTAYVGRAIKLNDRMTSFSHTTPVEVEAGRTSRVEIGGTGRLVVGRVIAPAGTAAPLDSTLGMHHIRPKLKQPTPPEGLSQDQKAQWFRQWLTTEEGREFQQAQRRSYAVKVESDGSFRVEDVPAGTYLLSIQVNAPVPGDRGGFGELLGSAAKEFTVPEMPGGRSDDPLDIGSLELTLVGRLQVGDAAPSFEVKTVDGKPLKLDDYRGKYVLLDFWATWCGPCRGETPSLKAVHQAFGKDDRFAMVGLSLDAKPDEPKTYAAENDLSWTQGFLGEWTTTNLPDRYGVRGIPSIWLIGPDGKVVAKDLRGDGIKAAVAEALGRKEK